MDKGPLKDGQLAHHFKIRAQCQKQIGDTCGSDRVEFFIKVQSFVQSKLHGSFESCNMIMRHPTSSLRRLFFTFQSETYNTHLPVVVPHNPHVFSIISVGIATPGNKAAKSFAVSPCSPVAFRMGGTTGLIPSTQDLTSVDVAASTVLPMYLSNLSPSKDATEESLAT